MKHVVFALAVAMGLGWVTPSWAERGSGDQASASDKRTRLRALRTRLLKERVGLTEDEIRQVESALSRHRDDKRAAGKKMRAAQRRLQALFRDDSDDEVAWQAALDQVEAARRAQFDVRAALHRELGQFLSAKKRAKLLRVLHRIHRRGRKRKR